MEKKNDINKPVPSVNIDLATLWYPTEVHFHDNYEFYYLINGHTTYIINDVRHELRKNDIVWVPPKIAHSIQVEPNSQHKRLLLLIPPHLLTPLFNEQNAFNSFFSMPRIIHMGEKEGKKISRYCNLILEEDWSKDDYQPLSFELLLSLLMVQTFRLVKNNTTVISNATKLNETIATILRYVNNRYNTEITLSRLATQVHMTPNYISFLFRKHLNTTFTDYLLSIRISKACDFLCKTDMTITEIAQKCGFNSLNHFCKSFKKSLGVSPATFRKISQ